MYKICSKCKTEKLINLFHCEKNGKFGVKSRCKECVTALSKTWKDNNQDREKNNRKQWNQRNKERHKLATYNWRKENKQKHNQYCANYQTKKKQFDPLFKFMSNMRSMISTRLSNKNVDKDERLENYLGCSLKFFKEYISNQFSKKMSWDNYGAHWSIDHICPCNQAKNKEEIIKLQSYKNLRPMVTRGINGNMSKSDKKTKEAEVLCLQLLKRDWID